jgi:benzylsuccinate CoA-transferase BbsF subunit
MAMGGLLHLTASPATASTPPTAPGQPSLPSPDSPSLVSSPLPLAGVRVIDFTWIAAGPLTAKYLGDYGAEVIRVESWAHPDSSRYAPPSMGREPGDNQSYFFATFNTSKYSVSLNLSRPEARDLVRRLVATADVVIESFTPQVMQKWELDYASLAHVQPDLIMLSTCMQGQTGPHAPAPGFGNLMAGLLGFYELTGWPDGAPCDPCQGEDRWCGTGYA